MCIIPLFGTYKQYIIIHNKKMLYNKNIRTNKHNITGVLIILYIYIYIYIYIRKIIYIISYHIYCVLIDNVYTYVFIADMKSIIIFHPMNTNGLASN